MQTLNISSVYKTFYPDAFTMSHCVSTEPSENFKVDFSGTSDDVFAITYINPETAGNFYITFKPGEYPTKGKERKIKLGKGYGFIKLSSAEIKKQNGFIEFALSTDTQIGLATTNPQIGFIQYKTAINH